MSAINRIREEIKNYIMKNGQEYERLLMSRSYYEKLKKETSEAAVDFPRLELKEDVDYDFKLLP
ncbi:MAG: hypothetical protein R3281_11870 [Balneolaceae bacterium]|nr:hypothetical protein [Balneolaceae bacterium]